MSRFTIPMEHKRKIAQFALALFIALWFFMVMGCASTPVVVPPPQCPVPATPPRPVLLNIPSESPPSIIEKIQALNFEAVMAYAARLEAILTSME